MCSILIYLAVFCGVFLFGIALLVGRTEREDEMVMILSVGNGSFYVDEREADVDVKHILAEQSTPTPSVFPSTQLFRNRIPSIVMPSESHMASVRTKPTKIPKGKHAHHLPTFNRSCSFKTFAKSSGIHIRKFVGDDERSYSHGIREGSSVISSSLSRSKQLVFLHFSVRDNVLPLLRFDRSVNRLQYIDEHLWRWSGSMAVVVYCRLSEEPIVLDFICHKRLPSRLTLLMYVVPDHSTIFPINKLRNIGIQSVYTTHYIVMDMDMWPIRSLFEEMKKLPPHVLSDPKSAIIVPLLFFKLDEVLPNCKSYDSCIDL